MTPELDVRRLLIDAIPAAALVAFAAAMMSSQIEELDGKLVLLVVAGAVGVGLSWLLLLLRQPADGVVALADAPSVPSALVPPVAGAATRVSRAIVPVLPVTGSLLEGLESFSLAKEGAAIGENEDSFAVDPSTGTIAVSDGASSSFGSRVWSRALVDVVVENGGPLAEPFVGTVMAPAAVQWKQHHEAGELPWWAQEGLRRGGFATLLVVRVGNGPTGRAWQALAVGDSCVFHLRESKSGWQLLRAFPLETTEAFGSHPVLLSSVSPAPTEGIEFAGGQLAGGDVLIAATDAVSEWLLGDPSRLTFAVTASIAEVASAVSAARQDRSMVNDDATFVRFTESRLR